MRKTLRDQSRGPISQFPDLNMGKPHEIFACQPKENL
jgi:hypothetical protein